MLSSLSLAPLSLSPNPSTPPPRLRVGPVAVSLIVLTQIEKRGMTADGQRKSSLFRSLTAQDKEKYFSTASFWSSPLKDNFAEIFVDLWCIWQGYSMMRTRI